MLHEAMKDDELIEKYDQHDYEIIVNHPKTFDLPDGKQFVVPDYETSSLRAKISTDENELQIVHIKVADSQQRRGLAKRMIERALEFARSSGLTMITSGLYSGQGKAVIDSYMKKGLVVPVGVRHVFKR